MQRRFLACFLFAALGLAVTPRPVAAAEPSIVIEVPSAPLQLGSECGTSLNLTLHVRNTGASATGALADPQGSQLTGAPFSGHGALPRLDAGKGADITVAVVSSLPPASDNGLAPGELPGKPRVRQIRLHRINLTLHVILDPAHKLGPVSPTADVPATTLTGNCVPEPTPTPAPTGLHIAPLPRGGVHLVIPTSPPFSVHPIPGGIHLVQQAPPAPTGVRQPQSMDDCRNFGGFAGGLVCYAIFNPGTGNPGTVLIWDRYSATVDGFRIYRRDGSPISPQIGANGNGVSLGYIPAGQGDCFYVTAFQGDNESSPSNPFCVGQAASTQNATLNPDRTAGFLQTNTGNTGFFANVGLGWLDPLGLIRGFIFKGSSAWSSTPVVGYQYRTHKSALGDSYGNAVARGAAHFDLRSLAGHAIYSAQLQLAVDFAYQGNDYHKSQASCATDIGTATQLWWDQTGDLSHADFSQGISPGVQGGYVNVDVTPIVRLWARGDPGSNLGFILKGSSEQLGGFTEASCFSQYQSISLQVNYF